ncbi:EF-hand domain-containing protein [Aspergillus clavatus NRRL 1]|uniref:EF hand domain protein n=1 Tax=Aspergillus clavatus (strain ATCC 1007 / CBS 513.65 / DSM 816 / NCTC 3887 / NRRL 1 / QM 1276 / 107) TaxID=344612 RepID=A1CJX3_ASPCL|nr:EF hand domain protein [Aspergillus clavatus NRRL 1]EAW09447.1 EF hand domain protein [Aspergillus clavatus NRRL 1]
MAYNKSYNPDALPAHAEPEQPRDTTLMTIHNQVAQMIGAMQGPSHQQRPPRTSSHPPSSGVPPQRVPTTTAQINKPLPATAAPTGHSRPHPLHPSPPPQNYGFGPPPSQPVRNRPPPSSRPPQSPQPPPLSAPTDDPQQLFPLFRAANASHSGALTEMELGSALVNGDYTSFHPRTVKMMIRMFDRNSSGSISFDEFVALWRFLAAWRELFDRFDEDRSGRISLQEFEKALVAFGYRLSQPFVSVLFTTFESKGRQMNGGHAMGPAKMGMSFDLFVQACIGLRRMTDVFKRYDEDRDGYITVSFEEFLTGKSMMQHAAREVYVKELTWCFAEILQLQD